MERGTERIVHTVSEYKLKFTPDQAKEMPMVDVAFEILKAANTPFYYRDLMKEIAKVKGLSEEEMMDVIAQVYTEINIDGRFACVGTNLWGLKRWYPIEKGDDAVGGSKRPRIINDDDDDDDDLYTEDEEESYDADPEEVEDYDALDDDRDEFFEEEEEEVEEEIDEDDEAEEDVEEELEDEAADEEEDDFADDIDDDDDR